MTSEQFKSWIKGLRGNKWKQQTGEMHNGQDQYCILGTICSILDPKLELYGVRRIPLYLVKGNFYSNCGRHKNHSFGFDDLMSLNDGYWVKEEYESWQQPFKTETKTRQVLKRLTFPEFADLLEPNPSDYVIIGD